MRIIIVLLKKEFIQIFRNKSILPIIFIAPLVQLLILSSAATFEIKKVKTILIDQNHRTISTQLIERFKSSDFFEIISYENSLLHAEEFLKNNKASLIILIPAGLEKELFYGRPSKIQFIINAEDGAAAGIISGYISSIMLNYNINLLTEILYLSPSTKSLISSKEIKINSSFWYNPELNYKTYMIPGILVLLVTMIGLFLSGMNIVREKELGTIEQLNVTPIKKHHFIAGKLIPFWIIALFDLAVGLIVSKIVFDIPIVGNITLIFMFSSIYLLVVLSIGLFISTITDTQQQSMFIAWFIMMIFMMLSGLFTSIENSPGWVQKIAWFNPTAYFIDVMRKIMLKGAGLNDIKIQTGIMLLYAAVIISLAVWRYRKVN